MILGQSGKIRWRKSFKIGVVQLKEKYVSKFPITKGDQNRLATAIDEAISLVPLQELIDVETLVAVAGTPTTLAAMAIGGFRASEIEGFRFGLDELQSWYERLVQQTPEEIEQTFSVPKGRSDVIVVGLLILIGVTKKVQKNEIYVSTKGLRYGVAIALACAPMQQLSGELNFLVSTSGNDKGAKR